MIAETSTQAAGSHGCPVHGMGGWSGVALPEQAGFFMAGKEWPDQDSSGVLGRDTERLAGHGLAWPREMRTAGQAWQGPQWSGYPRIGRLAWSDVDYQRETWICRHGDARTGNARSGSAGMARLHQASLGWASHGSAGMAWHRSERRGAAGVDLHCCDRMGLSWSCWHG